MGRNCLAAASTQRGERNGAAWTRRLNWKRSTMVLGYHAIWGVYGFWLPNDPRGSWSKEVWAPQLRTFGPARKTTERRSLAQEPHNRSRRRIAKNALIYPAVKFNEQQR